MAGVTETILPFRPRIPGWHGFPSACNNFILWPCEVDVLRSSVVFACATFHACLSLCWKQCVESFLNATSWPKMAKDVVIGTRASPSFSLSISDPPGALDHNALHFPGRSWRFIPWSAWDISSNMVAAWSLVAAKTVTSSAYARTETLTLRLPGFNSAPHIGFSTN